MLAHGSQGAMGQLNHDQLADLRTFAARSWPNADNDTSNTRSVHTQASSKVADSE